MGENARRVAPCRAVRGHLCVPGDKSISHRIAMLAGIADGISVVHGFLRAEDCLNTLKAMEGLGAGVEWRGRMVTIRGTAGKLRAPEKPIDLGNSGTGMRLLAGLLAGFEVDGELTGDRSLLSRPMRRIRDPLAAMGARIELLGTGCRGPIRVHGGGLHPISYRLPVASAQVKSCVLLAGLSAPGVTEVIEPRPTRDHTERLLAAMGVELECKGRTIRMAGRQPLHTSAHDAEWTVPGDFSSGAFWMAAAAVRPGSRVTLEGIGLNPRRTAFLDVLTRMGAGVEIRSEAGAEWEPVGSLTISGARLQGCTVEGEAIPNLIDELPLVAVAGAMANGRTIIRDAEELRVKESDRIASTAALLRAFGVEVEEQPDGMIVTGCGGVLPGAPPRVDSRHDHRIAMAGAVLALMAERGVEIESTACVDTSYPAFWDDLAKLTQGAS